MRPLFKIAVSLIVCGPANGAHLSQNMMEFQQVKPQAFLAKTGGGIAVAVIPQGVDFTSAEGALSLRFDGGQAVLKPVGAASLDTYLRGPSPFTRKAYTQVLAEHVYPGVDALFHVTEGQLEYDLKLAPHVSMDAIRLSFAGATGVTLDASGDLLVSGLGGVLRQKKPVVWQKGASIPVKFVLLREGRVGFRPTGKYDRSLPLTIDPVFVYERVFGGYNEDSPTAITTDLQGNVIIAGMTNSINFPTTSGAYQTQGLGPFRVSRDGGNTYSNVEFGVADTVSAVAFSNDGTIGYLDTQVGGFAIENGIYRTMDGGSTWTAVGGKLPFPSVQLVMDPATPSTVYAVGNGVYRSTDAGENWTKLNFTSVQSDSSGRALTICATDSKLLYLTSTSGQIFRSRDAGATWTKSTLPAYATASYVAVDPNNEKIVFYSGGFTNLFKSSDGGDTWVNPYQPPLSDYLIGARLRIDANSTLYVITSNGIHVSTDGGKSYTLIPNPGILNITSFEIDPFNAAHWVLAGEKVYQSYNAGMTWAQTTPAMGSTVVVRSNSFFVASAMNQEAFVTKWNPADGRVLWSTYLGVVAAANVVVADSQGNIYVGGGASVSKLSPDGSRLLATVQAAGSVNDLAFDSAGNLYVAGQGCSGALPGKILGNQTGTSALSYSCTGGLNSGYVEKFNARNSFSPIYAAYLAGTDSVTSLAVDAAGNAFAAGTPATNPSGNGFIGFTPTANALPAGSGAYLAEISAGGDQLLYESYMGLGISAITKMLFAPNGDLILTGSTEGFSLPLSENAYQPLPARGTCAYYGNQQDAFVLRLSPNVFGTGLRVSQLSFLGGNCTDYAMSVAFDFKGNIWISGETDSTDFPQVNAYAAVRNSTGALKGFVAEFNSDTSQLLFSQLFDLPARIAVSTTSVYVANSTGRFGSIAKWFTTSTAGGAALFTRIDP